ncbi:hypothetical protein Pcinc_003998 [Petrolisthes cinctipes]|uniref:Uncharacterized protein n=1 Tax=Petrolisthes cinctipes TaxID=88211 RepID=A0AAE1GI64_PETCI|nr:hypothetical protein Pcinc_003998 [Petrolisthes cinctipes]
MVVQAHADTNQLRDAANLDNPELLAELNKNDVDEKVRSKKVRVRVRADKDDDNNDKRKRVRVQNKDKTRSGGSPVKEQRQSCPGRCIRRDASCKGGRVLKNACKKGKCCITGDKKERQMDTDPKGYGGKRKCKPLESCNILHGECVKSKKYCKPGQVSVTNKDGLFCSKPNCKCCYMKEGGGCEPTAKCLKKKGHCVKDECHSGKAKMGHKWCTGHGCKCCLPKCVTKKKCTKSNGECKPKHECHGVWKEHKKLCKGKTCGCCISDEECEEELSRGRGSCRLYRYHVHIQFTFSTALLPQRYVNAALFTGRQALCS